MAHPSLSRLLAKDEFPAVASKELYERRLEELQRRMLLIQQGMFHARRRAIVALEGFDAAGKGGAIRRLTEAVDPRGVRVVPIGPPAADEQGRHWLYRFWRELPLPGTLTVFDRTWYGRVLVERVDGLAKKAEWKRAYREINEFERSLVDDGVDVVKIFLGISKDEQLRRFEERLRDPYKQWKLADADVRARKRWDEYVDAVDDMFARTDTPRARWHLVPADRKWYARERVLRIVTDRLARHGEWMEARVHEKAQARRLEKELKKLRS
ncbi:polyphosphate kinase 2 family protein [Anaeromyxobacter terrae]|uniref:polyphosphate kinase 2 family protein n=1 Tax=Anaeromyxobacter terrae TaxID=2925406 RepID=UPI001F5A6C37|nr:polyphosphate kinase [Anaeromyxobacter sp. SG22]